MDDTLQKFIIKTKELLDTGQYQIAKKMCLDNLASLNKLKDNYAYHLFETAGFLIDIGNEGQDIESVKIGLAILEKEEILFKEYASEQSYFYNLANGKSALHRVNNVSDRYPTLHIITENLIEAKNYYYKAYKLIDLREIGDLDLQIITNLAITLNQSGRIIEAIDLYSKVLDKDDNFIEAIISYSESLEYWMRISGCSQSISLYCKIYSLLDRAKKNSNIAIYYENIINDRLDYYKKVIDDYDYNLDALTEDLELSDEEYSTHSTFRKFSIKNHLTLNEHAVFCGCFAAAFDTLSVSNDRIEVIGIKAFKMELLLNRLKSEYHLARKLYMESIYLENSYSEVLYSELDDNEQIGEACEKLRTSFRLCFGMLDKIAHGICYFMEMKDNPKENIYFESFWKNPKRKDRWEVLKHNRNPHIIALYSIANDLNSSNGEFGFYKRWRNLLEHNNLILKDDEHIDSNSSLFDDEDFAVVVPYKYFKEQTMHLLQLCRSAIFSFTYFVRTEGMSTGGDREVIEKVEENNIHHKFKKTRH